MDIVKLNVGGVLYMTTRSTLCQCPDSMLGAMFSGNMDSAKDEDDRYFIDRDGELFGYILNFLRSCCTSLALPHGFNRVSQLEVEAEFYQIEPLIEAIRNLEKEPLTVDTHNAINRTLEIFEFRCDHNQVSYCKITGMKELLLNLPDDFLLRLDLSKFSRSNNTDYVTVTASGHNFRNSFGDYLRHKRWDLLKSDFSSAPNAHTKGHFENYRDLWGI